MLSQALTTHTITCRNYNRLKEQFDEEEFQSRINNNMEKTFGDYCFIYPKTTQEIKDETVQQNNCVASYIQSVIKGNCHILFLRITDKFLADYGVWDMMHRYIIKFIVTYVVSLGICMIYTRFKKAVS